MIISKMIMTAIKNKEEGMKEEKDNDRCDSLFPFVCEFCKKIFGQDVMGLGTHIGQVHDRQNLRKTKK